MALRAFSTALADAGRVVPKTMYADREEALRGSQRGASDAGTPPAPARADDPVARERELHEQLRRRAAESRRGAAPEPAAASPGAYDQDRGAHEYRASRRRGEDAEEDLERSWRRRRDDGSHYSPRYADDRYADDRWRRGGGGRRGEDSAWRGHYERYGGDSYRGGSPRQDDEYEARSVFCSQLAEQAEQRDLGEFLEEHLGPDTVSAVCLVKHRESGRSKGIAYVELAHAGLVPRAQELSGRKLFGLPILVQSSEAGRRYSRPNVEYVMRTSSGRGPSAPSGPIMPPGAMVAPSAGGGAGASSRLHVGNLRFDIGAEHLRSVFAPFGEVEDVEMPTDSGGRSRGMAFVQYKRIEDATAALDQLNGFELAGRQMRISTVASRAQGGPQGMTGYGPRPGARAHTITSSFDEGGGAGVSSSAQRYALMEKLARTDPASTGAHEQARPATIPESVTASLVLKHMFSPAEYVPDADGRWLTGSETERNWDTELREDVRGECEKYGQVLLVHVERDSPHGEVFVSFRDVDACQRAKAALHGRFFGGNRVEAILYVRTPRQLG